MAIALVALTPASFATIPLAPAFVARALAALAPVRVRLVALGARFELAFALPIRLALLIAVLALPVALATAILGLRCRSGDQRVLAAIVLVRLHRLAALLVGLAVLAVALDRLLTLALLGGLGNGIQNTKVMLGVLEVALGHDAVAGAGRIPAKLQIFLEKLLGGAPYAQVGPVAVEDMVAIERDLTVVVAYRAPAATATAATTARTMVAASHAFHVHQSVTALS